MVGLLRRLLPFLAVAVVAAVLYDAWVFYSRWSQAREAARATQAQKASDARRTIEMLGGGELKILSFYVSPAAIRRGASAILCYGVTGAKSVRIEPHAGDLHPALSYCLQVAPGKDTEYKLTVEDAAGHTASQRTAVKVLP